MILNRSNTTGMNHLSQRKKWVGVSLLHNETAVIVLSLFFFLIVYKIRKNHQNINSCSFWMDLDKGNEKQGGSKSSTFSRTAIKKPPEFDKWGKNRIQYSRWNSLLCWREGGKVEEDIKDCLFEGSSV